MATPRSERAEATARGRALSAISDPRLVEVARFDHEVTGVSVSEDGRIFVNFPRWTEDIEVSVAELLPDGSLRPYDRTRAGTSGAMRRRTRCRPATAGSACRAWWRMGAARSG